MSKIVSKPKVYLLGAQEVRQSGMAKFLADHNINWQSDTDIPAQVLTESAGRTCFDDRTELLTRTGWKPVSEVSIADEIATLNPETRHLEYQKPIAYHEYDYKGNLLTTEGRDVSFAVTPEHRQFVSLGGKFDWKDFNFIQTKDLPGKRFKIITAPENWTGEFPEKIIFPAVEFNQIISNQYNKYGESTTLLKPIKIKNTKLLSELVAHYIANGSICSAKGTGHGIVIYGREFKEICTLAQGLGFKTNVCEDKRNGCKRTKINGGKVLAHWFEKECGRGFRAKRFPQWVMNLPKEQLRVIWSILVKTDGHRYKNGREIVSTGSITVSGQLQEMLCKMGFSSYITCKVTNDVPCWTVSKKAGNPAVRSGSSIEKVSYIGKVYCPTTNNGIVYIRRNGKVHFSGNCYMSFECPRPGGNKTYIEHIKESKHGSVFEHGVWNFLFTDVSRSLTHELIRHRAGMGYSQLSQRFVDSKDVSFVIPDLIEQDAELYEEWLQCVIRARDFYAKCSKRLQQKLKDKGLKGTDAKKRANQAARSVLPNATETKIFVTANARAIRHFLEQRGSAGADREIRQLANVLLETMLVEAPALFCDYKTKALEDGTFEITTDYPKV